MCGVPLFVLLVSLGACLPDFPTLPDIENPSDPIPRYNFPVVWISDPMENGIVKRDDLFGEGAMVNFQGDFKPGEELHLVASRTETPDVGFFIQIIPVTDSLSPGPAKVIGSPTLVNNSARIRFKLRVRDVRKQLLSIDSVTVNLR